MAKATAVTRIPQFSRLPQLQPTSPKPLEIGAEHLGRRVKTSDKEGFLRYIGPVQFAKGTWCGVELTTDNGKHDGTVNGVRYFACPPQRGLMTAVQKVALVEEEALDCSGPYSMLFVDERTKDIINCSDLSEDEDLLERNLMVRSEEPVNLNQTVVLGKEDATLKRTFVAHADSVETDDQLQNLTYVQGNTPVDLGPKRRKINRNPSLELQLQNSTPTALDRKFEWHKVRISSIHNNDLPKRDSLECDESCGILTPDQMVDDYAPASDLDLEAPYSEPVASPKDLSLGILSESLINNFTYRNKVEQCPEPVASPKDLSLGLLSESLINNCTLGVKVEQPKSPANGTASFDFRKHLKVRQDPDSPNLVDASITDYSLGILDERVLSNLSTVPYHMNLVLPLENVAELSRLEQTPSPEDLPLDPTPIAQIQQLEDAKHQDNNSKGCKPNSFITSITSITSLDTGYQGDGEMSRPASRGPDNSPITRRPLPKPQNRPDPMTDSDFYTESDADNHEEHNQRGDRKAQVIDGTLYGVDAQATADLYANNRENMDSSGIFTDVENNPPSTVEILDVSPTTSTKTISENSQTAAKPNQSKDVTPVKKVPQAAKLAKSDSTKKYKMPKRDVASKVKAMIVPTPSPNEKKTVKKPVNRWDNVMSKISKNDQNNKTSLKEVKSKVFNTTPNHNNKTVEVNNKLNIRLSPNPKTPNSKPRRTRMRSTAVGSTNSPRTPQIQQQLESSINSSLSDISSLPQQQLFKKTTEKKKLLTPQSEQKPKKYNVVPSREKDTKKPESPKIATEGGRTNGKPRTALPSKHSQTDFEVQDDQKTVEALSVLVQHLVFNVDAFSVPTLKSQLLKSRSQCADLQRSVQALEDNFNQKQAHHTEELDRLVDCHNNNLQELNAKYQRLEASLQSEKAEYGDELRHEHDEQLASLKAQFAKLQANYEERLDIMREENEAIRVQIDEEKLQCAQLRREYDQREHQLKDKVHVMHTENLKLIQQRKDLEQEILHQTDSVREENERLRKENDRLLSYGDEKGIGLQEVQSLRVVLELKQNDVAELRKALAKATQRLDVLKLAEERANGLSLKCQDLQSQLQRKADCEQTLIAENVKLSDSLKEENNKNSRLVQHNEELHWKLKQNREVISHILEQTSDQSFNSSVLQSSFNEKTFHSLNRSLSFKDDSPRSRKYSTRTSHDFEEEDSPPASPKIKGVVEKSDSVSYVLDLDESPDVVAQRIVRRSFRNSTPPKTTPTKSPTGRKMGSSPRQRTEPLEFPAKGTTIWNSTLKEAPKLDDNSDLEDDDISLPALPSAMNKSLQSLPTPKHLAGEAMISESASEDESTSSSQL